MDREIYLDFYGTVYRLGLIDLQLLVNTTFDESDATGFNCSYLFQHSQLSAETSPEDKTLDNVYIYLYHIVIPIVCAFGFFGNILNVAVFTKKKTHRPLDEMEYCTTICLVALAVSDMMFCMCTFPQAFSKFSYKDIQYYGKWEFMLYYKMYAGFAISTFILSSTMLTVLTAIMRYMAICHPFHSRQLVSFRKTIFAIIALFVFSFAFNLPYVWRHVKSEVWVWRKWGEMPGLNTTEAWNVWCVGPVNYIKLVKGEIFTNDRFVYTHRFLWTVLGNFIPLALLFYCNIRLIKALRQSRKLRFLHSRDNEGCLSAHRRINITLITIIMLFFILVAPSEISKFILHIKDKPTNKQNSYTYLMVSMITNALQCINFSVNFILYYIIIAPFRKTLHDFICVLRIGRRSTRDSSNSQKHPTCILLTVKEQRRSLL